MDPDDGFKPLLADDELDADSLPLGDLPGALEDFSTGLVGSAKPSNSAAHAPVYIYVDDFPLSDGARTFEQESNKGASAQWHSQHVKIAQIILLTTSSVQCLLGLMLSFIFIGILPLASGILGIISATRYFVDEDSNGLGKALDSAIVLGFVAAPLNIVFDFFYLIAEFETEFLVPVIDILAFIFFGQAAAFLWILVRARRVKVLLLPNSSTQHQASTQSMFSSASNPRRTVQSK